MKNLNPTLWRTCRMLSGDTRIRLLRALHDHPGRAVCQLAKEVGIGRSDASQELRRIQSRGLLRTHRENARVIYRMEADPQVSSAAPLLKALKSALATFPPERDEAIGQIAFGLAYPRRIAIAQALLEEPQSGCSLSGRLAWSTFAVYSHLQILRTCGWVSRIDRRLHLTPPEHPLAEALVRLLRTEGEAG
jgi:DNA-binding transcriptional ArsR family regulator